MDKKKVKELIYKAKNVIYCVGDNTLLDYERTKILSKANKFLDDAVKELSKSDWVSVEDELPKYGEKILACDEQTINSLFITLRHKDMRGNLLDNNGFLRGLHITHWKPIEKLEE